jgi:23S rRNA (cytosine1962-C5)-methyltransferase
MELPLLRLKPREDRRLRQGHLWIYSNEIDTNTTPLKSFVPGQQAMLETSNGKALGVVYVNPSSLISARLISRDISDRLDTRLLTKRLIVALALRERIFPRPFYRMVYGDSDGLPGLIVDRFDSVLVVQISTLGMELVRENIIEALVKVIGPTGILLKDNAGHRKLEELPEHLTVAYGEVPPTHLVEENGIEFIAPLMEGQKTGWFYDHRASRERLAQYAGGKSVLDVYAYLGGWGIQALRKGASQLTCIERSQLAMDCLEENATMNHVRDQVQLIQGDAFDSLEQLCETGEKFDIVIVDPPAFIKRKKDRRSGEKGYGKLNQLAMRLVQRDGLLATASCSMHLARENFTEILSTRARHLDKQLLILEQYGQAADHPVHPAIPETEYLKTIIGVVR